MGFHLPLNRSSVETTGQPNGLPVLCSFIILKSNDTFNLGRYGVDGEIVSSPEHTEGSISVVIDKDKAIVGDLISSGILLGGIVRTHKAKRPPFEDNALQVSQQLESIANKGVNTFLWVMADLCHKKRY